MANSPAIDWRAIGTGPNPFQSMPILTNPVPIRGHLLMPVSIHSKPIHSQSFIPAQSSQPAKQSQVSQQRTTQSQQQFHENLPSQSDANPMSISAQSEDICLDNLGTSPLYGMVPSLLGGRNSSHPVTIQCQLGSNPLQTEHRSQVNPAPIQCQSNVKMGSFQTR